MYLVVYKCSNMQLFYETKQYVVPVYGHATFGSAIQLQWNLMGQGKSNLNGEVTVLPGQNVLDALHCGT